MRRTVLCVTLAAGLFCLAAKAEEKPKFPGKTESGFLLPNGWTISPAGEQVILTDLPLNIIPLADSRRALVATSGYNSHDLVLIDLAAKSKLDSKTVRESWYGLATNKDQDKIWWSGGGANVLHMFDLKDNQLTATATLEADPSSRAGELEKLAKRFRGGIAIDHERGMLYSLDTQAGLLMATDLAGKQPGRTLAIGGHPYDVALARNGSRLYISDWSSRTVLAINPDNLRVMTKIGVGEHPNQIAVHPSDDRIFVACASSNSISVIDTRRGIVTETIVTSLFPKSPEGSTPDAVALSPDGETLYAASADNNCIAVVDIERVSESRVKGFIPTGWYPTSVAVTPDGKQLLVGVGKGNGTKPNPQALAKQPEGTETEKGAQRNRLPFPYIGTTLSGALSIVPVPDEAQLAAYTETVYRNCPYSDKLLTDAPYPEKTAIPNKVGEASPIKHVIYIIKENRTYDQVYGDMPRGNGDASLVMFGAEVTPNQHKLAGEFVLLDNLYCNGHVSADGHPWSTMAYNTDYIARNWALGYSGRADIDDDDEGNLSKAPSGYLWDACARAGLSYRNYGEYGMRVSTGDGALRIDGAVPGLVGHVCPKYGLPNKDGHHPRDPESIEVFLEEFREFETSGNLPRLIIVSMGEDHTFGTKVGEHTPQACVASNDLALGRLVEGVSHSKYWPELAIFVIEDDAQNGADHVDAHRTSGLVISPYVKRHNLDSSQYATVSMIRTIELILGLAPLSQFDAAARPMFASFSDKADLTPYVHEKARINIDDKNTQLAYGADRSERMDFSEYDKIDDFELNEILWRAVKGKDAPLPPAVRRAIAYRPVVENPLPRREGAGEGGN